MQLNGGSLIEAISTTTICHLTLILVYDSNMCTFECAQLSGVYIGNKFKISRNKSIINQKI